MRKWPAVGLFILCLSPLARGADPQPYKVKLASTPDSALNAVLQGTSELISLRKTAPVGPFALIGRARSDINRLKTVLESYGYYQGNVTVKIDSLPLDDPTLGDELTNKPPKTDADVEVAFELGPQFHLGKVDLTGDVPPEAAAAVKLSPGAPAVAAQVLAAADRVRQVLAEDGYAFAKVDPPKAKENSAQQLINVTIHMEPGAKYRIGEIRLTGLKTINESYVRKRLLIRPGDQYKGSKIEEARRDLLAVGAFTQVTASVDPQPDASGQVPLTFKFRERKPHAVGLTGAYSSDLGVSLGVNWLKHEVTGNADSLTLSASIINLGGGTAANGIGYDLNGKYLIPDWKTRDQALQVQAAILKQSLDAYDQKAATAGVAVIRKLSSLWNVSAGLTLEQEQITQERPNDDTVAAELGCDPNAPDFRPDAPIKVRQCTYDYTLIGLPLNGSYNSTGLDSPLVDATHGVRASLTVTPTFSIGHKTSEFIITQLTAATYLDLQKFGWTHDPGRSVFAFRYLAGLAAGASQFSLPPDQRFYAGGSGTIRGYRFQAVGPDYFPDGNPVGGTAINAFTIEHRQRIGAALGFATFIDGGNVSDKLNPIHGQFRTGVGVGLRYYTALGPLRVDFAVPLQRRTTDSNGNKLPNPDDAFEVYIGLGQAF
jgi:translocation and assembly module TamA